MCEVSIVIPNFNGAQYLEPCLQSLARQTISDFIIIVVDNGSSDESCHIIETHYPDVLLVKLDTNYGFCTAVNRGIISSGTPYIILLNNDTTVKEDFVEQLLSAAKESDNIFSCQAKMMQMNHPDLMDDGGNYYTALGWAYAYGKGKPESQFQDKKQIFASCGGAAIYRRSILKSIGYFDEKHFAYLEDLDIGYRARIHGYKNVFVPEAKVLHVGSGTSGSTYNLFKVRYASRNSIYVIYKNMPWIQIVLNLPFFLIGFGIKTAFFMRKGFGKEYISGIKNGFNLCSEGSKVRFKWRNIFNYIIIQWELWVNIIRKIRS